MLGISPALQSFAKSEEMEKSGQTTWEGKCARSCRRSIYIRWF